MTGITGSDGRCLTYAVIAKTDYTISQFHWQFIGIEEIYITWCYQSSGGCEVVSH
jgi:hypothetical protein